MIQDTATFTVKSLGLYRAEPSTEKDWKIINSIISDKIGEASE
jgi:hypothetical protein